MIYIVSSNNSYAIQRFKQEAERAGVEMCVLDLNGLLRNNFKLYAKANDVLYIRNPYLKSSPQYIKNIINLGKAFKAMGGRVVDANIVFGQLGLGKWVDYMALGQGGLPIPQTELFDFQSKIIKQMPYILKWVYGMKAKGIFLVRKPEDLSKVLNLHRKDEWLVQEYVQAKYEYKVICVGFRALPVVLKFKFNKNLGRVDFNSFNILTDQSKVLFKLPNQFFNTQATVSNPEGQRAAKLLSVRKLAETASKILGRELSKVDILEDYRGMLWVLEVNRFPGLKSFEQLTQYNVIGEFLKYLKSS